ncbi:MAG: dTDP-glucose 4,6-dehydratase [Pseudomonadota bacterium]
MARLFVTGGAGFIGSAVVRMAIARGHSVLNVDKLTYAANLANLTDIEADPNYRFEEADICDGQRMSALLSDFKPDAIMHLAAETHVDRSIDGPGAFVETNIVGTYTLLQAARGYIESGDAETGFRVHHVSTDEVFGSLGATGHFTEDSPYQPRSPYSAAKASSDMLVRAWGETFDVPFVISNCSNNYGPYQFPEKLLPVVIETARKGEPIPVYGKGDNVRDWLFVDDHADALLLIAEKGTPGETYMVGGRAELTNLQLVKRLCAELDRHFPDAPWHPHESLITFVEDRPGHDQRYAVDCSKMERTLGWVPQTDLHDGLARTVDWYLSNEAWLEDIRQRGFDGGRLGLARKAG